MMLNYGDAIPTFSKAQLQWLLTTHYVGRRFFYRPVTESTMDDARRMAERGMPHGMLILAEEQSAGRGRAGRGWVSPPDVNLHFTILLYPDQSGLRPLSYVTPLAVALAVEAQTAATGRQVDTTLKWPNDVLIADKKLAGVLIETENLDGKLVACIGVGINVNLEVATYPEIRDIATSVREALGYSVSREELLATFCNQFEALYEESLSGSKRPFEMWRERLVTLGREVVAQGPGIRYEGRAVDVDEDGALIIAINDGERVRVEAGDVTLRPSP